MKIELMTWLNVILTEVLFLLSRRGKSVSELSDPRNQSESSLLDAQRHSGTALGPVGLAPMTAAAHPPSPAPYSSASTALMERASTEMSCGSRVAAAVQAVVYTADRPTLQSVSTTTPIPSGTEGDSLCLGLTWQNGYRLCTYPSLNLLPPCLSAGREPLSSCHPQPIQAIHLFAL